MSLCFSDQVVDSDRPEGSKFRLTGKGVDQEPKGIFRINENTGSVSVTRNLDRETIATYQVSTPRVPTPHTETCLSETAFLPLSSLFLCFINPGLHGFKCVSVGAEWHWTLTSSNEGPCLISRALRVCVKLWAWKTKKGPLGDLRGGQKLYVNVGFPETRLIMKRCKKNKPLDLLILLREIHPKEIGRNSVSFLYNDVIARQNP